MFIFYSIISFFSLSFFFPFGDDCLSQPITIIITQEEEEKEFFFLIFANMTHLSHIPWHHTWLVPWYAEKNNTNSASCLLSCFSFFFSFFRFDWCVRGCCSCRPGYDYFGKGSCHVATSKNKKGKRDTERDLIGKHNSPLAFSSVSTRTFGRKRADSYRASLHPGRQTALIASLSPGLQNSHYDPPPTKKNTLLLHPFFTEFLLNKLPLPAVTTAMSLRFFVLSIIPATLFHSVSQGSTNTKEKKKETKKKKIRFPGDLIQSSHPLPGPEIITQILPYIYPSPDTHTQKEASGTVSQRELVLCYLIDTKHKKLIS